MNTKGACKKMEERVTELEAQVIKLTAAVNKFAKLFSHQNKVNEKQIEVNGDVLRLLKQV